MRNHAALILFIAAMILAAGTVAVISDVVGERQEEAYGTEAQGPQITQVTAWNIQERQARFVRLDMNGGDEPLNLSEALISVRTEGGASDLVIR